jgi:hypothetical protein
MSDVELPLGHPIPPAGCVGEVERIDLHPDDFPLVDQVWSLQCELYMYIMMPVAMESRSWFHGFSQKLPQHVLLVPIKSLRCT